MYRALAVAVVLAVMSVGSVAYGAGWQTEVMEWRQDRLDRVIIGGTDTSVVYDPFFLDEWERVVVAPDSRGIIDDGDPGFFDVYAPQGLTGTASDDPWSGLMGTWFDIDR